MKRVGFMFGAGAEIDYGLPTGGDFALNIFKEDSTESKVVFKKQRENIDKNGIYAQWLPKEYDTKTVNVFGKKAYEDIIRGTIEQSRRVILGQLDSLDEFGAKISDKLLEDGIDISADFLAMNGRELNNSFMDRTVSFVDEFKEGNGIFKSNYFSALLFCYKNMKKKSCKERGELGRIIISILQLQVGALGEMLTHRINEGVIDSKDEEFDLFEDLGDIIQMNYQAVGMTGLEYLLEFEKAKNDSAEQRIILFAQLLLEKVYAGVLDYKSLIDSNWMYLYHPDTEWSKFCKISIFLLNVQKYIKKQYDAISKGKKGYYDELLIAEKSGILEIGAIGTSNYSPLISNILSGKRITFLNGSTELWYDPYLNQVGFEADLQKDERHFIVPLMFTQSGTKPMISIEMSQQYVDYFNELSKNDIICSIGFGFNKDDEHINGMFRNLIDKQNKKMIVVTRDSGVPEAKAKSDIAKKLKVRKLNNLKVLMVDGEHKVKGKSWIDCLDA